MQKSLIKYLVCPECNGELQIAKPYDYGECGEIKRGSIVCAKCSLTWPIENYIPRFVPKKNYASSFGFQWNRQRASQLDSMNGLDISNDRFYNSTKWPKDMTGSLILEAGCGAGRFTEIALKAGAKVISFDYSTSVDAGLSNMGLQENLHVIQADIYNLPLKKELFDRIFCFGVLQHVPNVEKAFARLIPLLKREGSIAVDVYGKSSWLLWRVKYRLRPFTKRINNRLLYHVLKLIIPSGLKLKIVLNKRKSNWARKFGEAIPILNYKGIYPLSDKQLRDWALLDTFDMLSPEYDQPQDIENVNRWFSEARLSNIEVEYGGNGIVGRAIKS